MIVGVIVSARNEVSWRTVSTLRSFYRDARVISARAFDAVIKNSRRSISAEFAPYTFRFIVGILSSCACPALVRSCRCCRLSRAVLTFCA